MAELTSIQGQHFSAVNLGTLENLDNYQFDHPALESAIKGKVFLGGPLQLTSAEISINKLGPGCSMPFSHNHDLHEEIYIFIGGKGEFQIDDQAIAVGEGTVLRVAPAGIRCWRNISREPLYYIVIQALSGSFAAGTPVSDGHGFPLPEGWTRGV